MKEIFGQKLLTDFIDSEPHRNILPSPEVAK